MGLYAAVRFAIEYFRDDDRGALLGLSTSQLIGVVIIGVAAYLHTRLSKPASPPVAA